MKKAIILVLLGSCMQLLSAQPPKIIAVDDFGNEIPPDTSRWMPQRDVAILKSMKLTYRKPARFEETTAPDCFKDNPKLEAILGCQYTQLRSNDKEFIAFIYVNPLVSKRDSILMKSASSEKSFDVIDRLYAFRIRAHILNALGKNPAVNGPNALFNWKEQVTYYPDSEAKRKFNADTAIHFFIALKPDAYYKGKYRYLKTLVLQKKKRNFITIYCFYTQKGKRNLKKYWSAIEQAFYYENNQAPIKRTALNSSKRP